MRRYFPCSAGKTQQKSSGDSLTVTGKGEKDHLDIKNLADRLILSTLGSGGRVQEERGNEKKIKRSIFSMFDSISRNTQKDRDSCNRKHFITERITLQCSQPTTKKSKCSPSSPIINFGSHLRRISEYLQ